MIAQIAIYTHGEEMGSAQPGPRTRGSVNCFLLRRIHVGWSEGSCVERRGTRARPGSRNFLGCNEVISRKLQWDMQMYLP